MVFWGACENHSPALSPGFVTPYEFPSQISGERQPSRSRRKFCTVLVNASGVMLGFSNSNASPSVTNDHVLLLGMGRNPTLIRAVRAVLWDNVEGACFRVASSLAGI
jgi:hypothetical protein